MITTAVWCVLIAGLLPFAGTIVAKGGARMPISANKAPREWLDQLQNGWQKRAHWYQLNSFEAFPFFAAAVITAQMRQAPQLRIDHLATAFVVFRLLHLFFYLSNLSPLRSLVWFGALGSAIWIFVLPA